ncbi:MAG TPA: hypothetical protein EYP57_00210 [Thermodesulfobacteriaceae bacterium]|nr:hypothetical protein [Thermodesulfobacteriaceae bacterium]
MIVFAVAIMLHIVQFQSCVSTVWGFESISGPSNCTYRLIWNSDPSTTMLIIWDQLRVADPRVCFGRNDAGRNCQRYPYVQKLFKTVKYLVMNSCFAMLQGLKPDTV